MEKANIDRINELSRLARTRALTPEEQTERAQCRAAYLAAFRAQMRENLDNTVVQYPDGSTRSLRDCAQKKE